jgi:hypothetical protein
VTLERLRALAVRGLRAVRALFWALFAPLRNEGRGYRSPWILVLGILLILSWQRGLMNAPVHRDEALKLTASTGVHDEPRFFFQLFHTGLYPLVSTGQLREDTSAEALRQLHEAPGELAMDSLVTFRSGDRGRVFLYFPDALWFRRHAEVPRLRPAHALAWMASLCVLFAGFWAARRPILGAIIVAFVGSSAFALHHVYWEENVFCWPFIALAATLGLHAPLLDGRPPARWVPWGVAALTGLLLGAIRTVRSEPVALLASAAMVYLALRGSWARRVALVVTLVGIFSVTSAAYARFFVANSAQVAQVLRAVGGVPYTGPVEPFHEFWHPVWCGLGDFDAKYGFAWDDRQAYRYALPILEARAGRRLDLDTAHGNQSSSYDGAGRYPRFFSETPGYHQVIRERVLTAIREDPRWYGTILLQRAQRILRETTPVQLAWGAERKRFTRSWVGWGSLALLAALSLRRDGPSVRLLLFSTPLSLNAWLIYSGGGLTLYSAFHLVAAAIVAYGALRALSAAVRFGYTVAPTVD